MTRLTYIEAVEHGHTDPAALRLRTHRTSVEAFRNHTDYACAITAPRRGGLAQVVRYTAGLTLAVVLVTGTILGMLKLALIYTA